VAEVTRFDERGAAMLATAQEASRQRGQEQRVPRSHHARGRHELVKHGHEVFIEKDAGIGSSITDDDFVAAGATILPTADDVWATGDLVLKVKEPIAEEYHRMREGQTLFTYLHLAADRECTEALLDARRHRHRVRDRRAARPARCRCSPRCREVAGRLAPQVGAHALMRANGGRGVLMGGVSGTYAAKVVVLGAGVSGQNAAAIALGMQAEVLLLDLNIERLRQVDAHLPGNTCRPSRRTPTRSSGRCWTPTW
jgi:alanine dehydrogenase